MRSLIESSIKITDIFLDNPLNTPYPEVVENMANHLAITGREKAAFYA